jgi:L-alanine-DL-glutamate epimerase-like enolase superfamily enzyme
MHVFRIVSIDARPLRVPLIEPFVIASATMTTTRALVIEVTVDARGQRFVGRGEAATLPPVTRETDDEILAALPRAVGALAGREAASIEELAPRLDAAAPQMPVFRAALEAALLDAMGRAQGVPVARLLAPALDDEPFAVRTDITLPITETPSDAARLAEAHAANGFDRFKVKVGKDLQHDLAALSAVLDRVPSSRLRLDANGGFSAREALALLDALGDRRARVECFEQPCAKADLAGMAEVTKHAGLAVVADESIATEADLDAILRARAAHGINLKLVKHGGLVAAHALGRRAKHEGLSLMAGAMVETRLGLVAMAHVVWALGGVDFVDLDTAFLLADDPFSGGWTARGPDIVLASRPGLDVDFLRVR